MKTLFPHQLEAVEAASRYLQQHPDKTPLLVEPTGSGKSVIIAEIVRRANIKKSRVLVLTHTFELIEQNALEIVEMTSAGVRVFHSGQKKVIHANKTEESIPSHRSREDAFMCDLATIQTYHNALAKDRIRSDYKLIIIDEAHRVNNDRRGVYAHVIEKLKRNGARVIGLTATPYRLNQGHLCDGKYFDGIAHETDVRYLIDNGFLCEVVTPSEGERNELIKFDFSNLQISSTGDYTQASIDKVANEQMDALYACVTEALQLSDGRKKFMIFAMSTQHIEPILRYLRSQGRTCAGVDATTPKHERKRIVDDFRDGKIKHLVNFGVFTTGFNVKDVDCIINFRPTTSPALYVQIVGRVMRVHPSKVNGLYIDYGANIERHGAIDNVEQPKKKNIVVKDGKIMKKCPACAGENKPSTPRCVHCAFEFPRVEPKVEKLSIRASTAPILTPASDTIAGVRTTVERVHRVTFNIHVKNDASPYSLRINYFTFDRNGIPKSEPTVSEYMNLNHDGFARVTSEAYAKLFFTDSALKESKETAITDRHPNQKKYALRPLVLAGNDGKIIFKPAKIRTYKSNGYKRIMSFIIDDKTEILKPYEKLPTQPKQLKIKKDIFS